MTPEQLKQQQDLNSWYGNTRSTIQALPTAYAQPLTGQLDSMYGDLFDSASPINFDELSNAFNPLIDSSRKANENYLNVQKNLNDWYGKTRGKIQALPSSYASPLDDKLRNEYANQMKKLDQQTATNSTNLRKFLSGQQSMPAQQLPKPVQTTAPSNAMPITAQGAMPSTVFNSPMQQAAVQQQNQADVAMKNPALLQAMAARQSPRPMTPQQGMANPQQGGVSFSNFVKQYKIPKPSSMQQAQQIKTLWQNVYGANQ